MSNDKKLNPEDIASKLEAKAKRLRESGLSQDDLDMVAGGSGCECCGSSCQSRSNIASFYCSDIPRDNSTVTCVRSCIYSSPD